MPVLITGANGFVGASLTRALVAGGGCPRAAVRRAVSSGQVAVGDIGPDTDWSAALVGVDSVVHLAARVHVMREAAPAPLAAFRRVNVEGTANLARQAAEAGVRRFVFLSSIKVNGEGTPPGKPFRADDPPRPVDPYAISKHEAEQVLRKTAAETGMEAVIIRPPLVYGPGVKANFLSMMRWVRKGMPLPLGAIHNRRSLLALDNLVDLILACIEKPAAANQVFLAADGEDLSTPDLLRRLGMALDRPARLFPVHGRVLEAAAAAVGRRAVARRLCTSLQVDIANTREVLDWTPPVGVDAALRQTARHFLQSEAR